MSCHPRFPCLVAALALASALPLAACGAKRRAPREPLQATASRVDVFVRAVEPAAGEVTVELAAVRLRDSAGALHDLELELPTMRAGELRRRTKLAGAITPTGSYSGLVLVVRSAALSRGDSPRDLRLLPADADDGQESAGQPYDPTSGTLPEARPGEVAYEVPVNLTLARQQAVSVFLDWDVAGSVIEGTGFRPVLSTSLSQPQVRFNLLFVADPSTGSILAVDRRAREVVGTAKAGGGAFAVAIESPGVRLYVANRDDGSLSVVDTRLNEELLSVPIRLGAGTTDVAIAEPRSVLAAANSELDTVSLVDLLSTTRVADIAVGRHPVRLVAVPELRRVFTANAGSDDVSVVDVRLQREIGRIPAESVPSYVAADRDGRLLIVGHQLSPNLLIVDTQTLAPVDTIFVGDDVTAILRDRRRDRVYVARASPPEVVFVDLRLLSIVRRVRVEAPILGMVQPPDGSLVYGAAPDAGGLVSFDFVSGRAGPTISCGAPITDVALVE